MNRNKAVEKQFGLQPRADVPRSAFRMKQNTKTTMGLDNVTPIFAEEALPTDRWHVNAQYFGRLLTPIFPVMDNLWLEVFYFFVPSRLVWEHAPNFFSGRNPDPLDTTTYTIPQWTTTNASVWCTTGTLWDHFGLPVPGQPLVTGGPTNAKVSALIPRAYGMIWDEWFRDPNWVQPKYTNAGWNDDGPDTNTFLYPAKRYKRKDYFTSTLPWPQARTNPVSIGNTTGAIPVTATANYPTWASPGGTARSLAQSSGTTTAAWGAAATATGFAAWVDPALEITAANFNTAMGNVNTLRFAFQAQKLFERDARSGPRYTEQLFGHWGILPQDSRMQRPEYLGSAKKNLTYNTVPQTSATETGGTTDTPLAEVSAFVTVNMHADFTVSIPEHGYVIGVANITGDVSYQQGIRRMWRRETRFEFAMPEFSHIGEQSVYRSEIFSTLNSGATDDNIIFGYIPAWDDYRYWPDMITGQMRSAIPNTLDAWHLAESFASAPSNGATFMEQNTPIERVLADQTNYEVAALKLDILHTGTVARPLPMFSVPGLVDHF